MSVNKIRLDGIEGIELSVSYSEQDKHTPFTHREMHMHEEYEIYICTDGDDTVELDGILYSIPKESVVVLRPYTGHRCLFRSEGLHCHFWLLLKIQNSLMDALFDDEADSSIIQLDKQDFKNITEMLHRISKGKYSGFEKYIAVFTMLDTLKKGTTVEFSAKEETLPKDVVFALEYMEKHIKEKISIEEIAGMTGVSINTLERHFSEYLQLSPSETLRRKRLITAAKFLSYGMSVTDSCYNSGFTDYSNFIAMFRKYFGMTPLKYQKNTKIQN